ncbi:MAG: AgmX/PglI C-terminal domain-containing protein [Bdellovibrionales bacterium]
MQAGRFVLENDKGETVRVFSCAADQLHLVYRHDVKRVEVTGDLTELDAQGIRYSVLRSGAAETFKSRPTELANGGRFCFVADVDRTTQLVQPPTDSKEQEKTIYKYAAYVQLGVMFLILILGLLIEPLFVKKPDPIVTLVPPPLAEKVPTVRPSERPVQPVQKFAKVKRKSPIKTITKNLTARTKAKIKANAPLRTKVKVENVGALGALGGMRSGSKKSAGFNMNALNDSKGTSWTGAGAEGAGGMERAARGKGLVASAMGRGEKVEGGGGYGTRGAGGGRPGYGQMNLGGTAAAYFEPVQEEASVEGGLTRDQIAAVINRHLGEVLMCYETGLQVNPKLSGRLNMRFVISGSGSISSAGVQSSSVGSPKVEGCIVNRLRGWRFPKPVGGVNVKVTYPFVLKRMSNG